MSQILNQLMSYGLDILSAQPMAEELGRYEESKRAQAFDEYMASVERWDNLNL